MKVVSKEAGKVVVGDYIFTGHPYRGVTPHPAFHWTQVAKIVRRERTVDLVTAANVHYIYHLKEGVAVSEYHTEIGKRAEEELRRINDVHKGQQEEHTDHPKLDHADNADPTHPD